MPPLLCPSPNIVDQSFPRSVDELEMIERALGRICGFISEAKCRLLLTPPLREFIIALDESFDWTKMKDYPGLQIVYSLLAQLGLQQHGIQTVDLTDVTGYVAHPLPIGCTAEGLGLTWTDELGRLIVAHNKKAQPGKFFVAVACTFAFAGRPVGVYDNPENRPAFPLVAPIDLAGLDDSLEWELPHDLHLKSVSFDDAYKKVKLLGGVVENPSGSSHYQVRFEGGRTWPLDRNYRVLPDAFVKQLAPITGYPFECIKYVLINGEWPPQKSRL